MRAVPIQSRGQRQLWVVLVRPPRQCPNIGLQDVTDRRQCAAHVAIESGISNGVFTLISSSKHQRAGGIGECHQLNSAQATLQILINQSIKPHTHLGKVRLQMGSQRMMRWLDWNLQRAHTKPPRQVPRISARAFAGELAGHQYTSNTVRPQGRTCKRSNQGTVNSARQSKHRVTVTRLAEIACNSRHNSVPAFCVLCSLRVQYGTALSSNGWGFEIMHQCIFAPA